MDRPYVICHILTALDGKIDGPFFTAPATLPALRKYTEVRKFYACSAAIYGVTTVAEGYADGFIADLPASGQVYPRQDYIANGGASDHLVVLDGVGCVKWRGKYAAKPGRPRSHVIEVLTEQAADSYLAYLRGLEISYIFAGQEKIDCALLLRKLKSLFGIDRALLAGGGLTNWSFAAAGLIDELSIVLSPTADGSSQTASLFEAGEFTAAAPVEFALKAVEKTEYDALWLRYLAKK